MIYTNDTSVPLSMAVYLANDTYDAVPDTISVTSLIKPLKSLILARRVPPEENVIDILQVAKSRIGTSIHDGIERAWVSGQYRDAMAKLRYPDAVIERIRVNNAALLQTKGYDPVAIAESGTHIDFESAAPANAIPVFTEIRHFKRVGNQTVSGKFDFVAEGRLEDVKSTSTFTYVNQTNTDKYKLQGSMYRWLNPELITKDDISINFVFTDWMAGKAQADPKYPQRQIERQLIPLLSIEETDHMIRSKLAQHEQLKDAPESDLPRCTDDDLWRKPPVYKYYKDPNKRTRSTKNFDTAPEAYARLHKDGNVGVVVEKPGEVVACKYCPAFSVCTQKLEYIADGSLKVE